MTRVHNNHSQHALKCTGTPAATGNFELRPETHEEEEEEEEECHGSLGLFSLLLSWYIAASFARATKLPRVIESPSNRLSGRSRVSRFFFIFISPPPLSPPVISGSELGDWEGGLVTMKLSYRYLSICRCLANYGMCSGKYNLLPVSYCTIQLPSLHTQ